MQKIIGIERIALAVYNDDPIHVSRYLFAAPYVKNRDILDIACGVGFGTRMLKEQGAFSVIGLDIEPSAMTEIVRTRSSGITFAAANATKIPLPSGCVDVIVSFETIEHIADYMGILREFCRTLRDDGVLLLSTPNAKVTNPTNGIPRNPFHVKEFDPQELKDILRQHFSSVEFYGQRIRSRIPESSVTEGVPADPPLLNRLVNVFPLSWRVELPKRLPSQIANFAVRQVTGHNRDIGLGDIEFSKLGIDNAFVILAVCRK